MSHEHRQPLPIADHQGNESSQNADSGFNAQSALASSTLNTNQRRLLSLQQTHGNQAVRRLIEQQRGTAATLQRDLSAYTREHIDVEPTMGEGVPPIDRYTADAPGIQRALQTLIDATKIRIRSAGDQQFFSNISATREEIEAALTAAGYARAAQMATALMEDHRTSVYSAEEVTYIPGLIWDTNLARRQQNLDVQARRSLTGAEHAAAESVFGSGINYDRIVLEDAPVMSLGGFARTTPWTINFPSGTVTGNSLDTAWLIHEMGHSWQYQHGVSMIRTLYHAVRGVYDYGGETRLAAETAAGHGLQAFQTEQQADIASDYYKIISGSRQGDVAVYQPYIDEFRSGHYR